MNHKLSGHGRLPIIIAILLFAGLIAVMFSLNRDKTQSTQNSDSRALMSVTSSGGMCNGPCGYPVHNLYDSGKFDGHKNLSSTEVLQLKNIIDTTDFTKYGPNPSPKCESFADGFDRVLLFPQKYGNTTFTTCMLNIPENDEAFSYINKMLDSHYLQQN